MFSSVSLTYDAVKLLVSNEVLDGNKAIIVQVLSVAEGITGKEGKNLLLESMIVSVG